MKGQVTSLRASIMRLPTRSSFKSGAVRLLARDTLLCYHDRLAMVLPKSLPNWSMNVLAELAGLALMLSLVLNANAKATGIQSL